MLDKKLTPKEQAIMISRICGDRKSAIKYIDGIRDELSVSVFSYLRTEEDVEKYDYFTQVKIELEKLNDY